MGWFERGTDHYIVKIMRIAEVTAKTSTFWFTAHATSRTGVIAEQMKLEC